MHACISYKLDGYLGLNTIVEPEAWRCEGYLYVIANSNMIRFIYLHKEQNYRC